MDYIAYLIDQIRGYVSRDNELSQIIPKNMDYKTKKEEYNVYPTYVPFTANADEFPRITIQTLQDYASDFNMANNEVGTDVGWQIDIYCTRTLYNNELYEPYEMCNFIKDKLRTYLEKNLKFRKITISPPITIDDTNEIYGLYLRYNAKYDNINEKFFRR